MSDKIQYVSDVIGTGQDAHRIVKIGDTETHLYTGLGDDDGLVDGRELAGWLGYSRDRDLYRLARRYEKERPEFGRIVPRATAARGLFRGNSQETKTVEIPCFTQRQVILLAMSAETDRAWEVKTHVTDVYLAVRDHVINERSRKSSSSDQAHNFYDHVANAKSVGDDPEWKNQVRNLISSFASKYGVTFAKAHGEIRRKFGLPGYLRTPLVLKPEVMTFITEILAGKRLPSWVEKAFAKVYGNDRQPMLFGRKWTDPPLDGGAAIKRLRKTLLDS